MKLLDIPATEKRNRPLALRLKPSTIEKLQKMAKYQGVSMARIVEHLIESTFSEASQNKRKK